MNLFNLGFSKIVEMVNEGFDQFFQGFFFYGAWGLLAGLIILFVINFVPLFRPKRRFFKIVNALNILYLPGFFALSFGLYGGLYQFQQHMNIQIKETIVPMTKVSFPAFQIYLVTNNDNEKDLTSHIEQFSSVIKLDKESHSWWESKKMQLADKELPKTIGWGIESIIDVEIAERGYDNPDRVLVARKMSFLKLRSSFWKKVEVRARERADQTFLMHYLKVSFLVAGMSFFLLFQIAVLVLRPKNS
jgi:hypothetical protein